MALRIFAALLIAVALALQWRLWFGDGGMLEVRRLREQVAAQKMENEKLLERNRMLTAEVKDLKQGTTAIEERARTDLGMVGQNESFYQVAPAQTDAANVKAHSRP